MGVWNNTVPRWTIIKNGTYFMAGALHWFWVISINTTGRLLLYRQNAIASSQNSIGRYWNLAPGQICTCWSLTGQAVYSVWYTASIHCWCWYTHFHNAGKYRKSRSYWHHTHQIYTFLKSVFTSNAWKSSLRSMWSSRRWSNIIFHV